jgi:serine/threonine-protein kinase RsbT
MDTVGSNLTERPFAPARHRNDQPAREPKRSAVVSPLASRAQAARPLSDPATIIPIRSDLDIVAARRTGRVLAGQMGFSPTETVIIATAISELARNIVTYAKDGEIELKRVTRDEQAGLAVVARDHGPGIVDIAQAMQDGFSTSGSLGLGLPGVKRLLDDFDIVSEPGRGTTITGRKWKKR